MTAQSTAVAERIAPFASAGSVLFSRIRSNAVLTSVVLMVLAAFPLASTAGEPCEPEWSYNIGQPGMNGTILAFEEFDDGETRAMYAGGSFTNAGGVNATRVARWDGAGWSSLGSGPNGTVRVLKTFDDGFGDNGESLYVGGNFGSAGGVSASRIVRWTGSSWSPLGAGANGSVFAMTVFDDQQGGGPALYVGGSFSQAGGLTTNGIARWDGTSWSTVGTGMGGVGSPRVEALAVYDDGTGPALYAGGRFTTAGGTSAPYIAKWDGTSWTSLGSGMNDLVTDLAVYNDGSGDALYAIGDFNNAGGVSASRIAKWDGTTWSFIGNLNGTGRALKVYDAGNGEGPKLYAGGNFGSAGGVSAPRIASWDGATWAPLSGGMNLAVEALGVFDEALGDGPALFVGGQFTLAGGEPSSRVAKWSCTGVPLEGNYWIGGNGDYHVAGNWLLPAVPTASDVVLFDSTWLLPDGNPINLPASYDVVLSSLGEASRMLVRTDEMKLNLFNNDFVLHQVPDDEFPSLVVGSYPDEDTRMIVRNSQFVSRTFEASSISIAEEPLSIGRLTFRNFSVVGEAHGNVYVGRRGQGTLIAEQNADFYYGKSGQSLIIGDEPGSVGLLNVQAGGRLLSMETPAEVVLGRQSGATGSVLLQGGGSSWTSLSNQLIIGESGHGNLTIQSSAQLFSQNLDGIVLGANAGSSATVLISGNGSQWTELAQAISTGAGQATISVLNGGVLAAPSINILATGAITGDSAIFGDLFNLGTIAPGSGLPGGLTINGNYRQVGPPPGGTSAESGSLQVRLGGSAHDSLVCTGIAELGGGLFVELFDGFQPTIKDQFEVFSASSLDTMNRRFDVAFLPGLSDGLFMKVQYVGASAFITVDELANLLGFSDPNLVDIQGQPTSIAVGDLNGNGSLDIAVTVQGDTPSDLGSLLVLINDGTGQSFSTQQFSVGVQPSAVALGDFSGVNGLDIAVANRGSNTVSLFLNNGGSFDVASPIPVGVAPSAIVAEDLGEGAVDLVVANEADNNIMILRNNGQAVFTPLAPIAVGAQPRSISAADLNSNGLADLVVGNFGDGTIMVMANTGNPSFQYVITSTVSVGLGPIGIDIEDLDNNKLLDISVLNQTSGDIAILKGLGGAEFSPPVNFQLGGEPRSFATVDLDSNGNVDIAIVVDDPASGLLVRILRNDTEQDGKDDPQLTFALADDVAEGEFPVLVASGDLTGNGVDNLITVNAPPSTIGASPTASTVAIRDGSGGETLLGDLNGDGVVNVSDLLLLLGAWGTCPSSGSCPADLNNDGVVNVSDLLLLLANWG
jgi:T5SS/PEP-CTERM-associated repeat protein